MNVGFWKDFTSSPTNITIKHFVYIRLKVMRVTCISNTGWYQVFIKQSFPLYSNSNFCLKKAIIKGHFPRETEEVKYLQENGISLPVVMRSNVKMLVKMAETFIKRPRMECWLACYSAERR